MHGQLLPHLEHGSPEWVERRKSLLGASDLAAALGLSPHSSPYSLWAEKTGRLGGPEETSWMRFGRKAESWILDEFTNLTGLYLGAHAGETFTHPVEAWASASPDAIVYESQSEDAEPIGTVDAKTAFTYWHARGEEPSEEHVPDEYRLQVAWQLFVTGLDRGWICLLAMGPRGFAAYPIDRDDHLIETVVTAGRNFWRMIEDDVEPPVDPHRATTKALQERWESVRGLEVELSPGGAGMWNELVDLKARLKPFEERRRHLENELKAEIGDAEAATINGRQVVTWKSSERRGYTVEPGTTRRFLVKD